MIEWFRSLFRRRMPKGIDRVILIDREGVAYLPTRKVVLRARA
ncbi:MAG: hypothetical protein ABFE07_06200 [Armatimonadia bacterium]